MPLNLASKPGQNQSWELFIMRDMISENFILYLLKTYTWKIFEEFEIEVIYLFMLYLSTFVCEPNVCICLCIDYVKCDNISLFHSYVIAVISMRIWMLHVYQSNLNIVWFYFFRFIIKTCSLSFWIFQDIIGVA